MSQHSVDELDADELHTFLSKQWPKAQQVIDQLKQNGITGLAFTAVEKPDLLECGFSMADALAVVAMKKKLLTTQTDENKSSDPASLIAAVEEAAAKGAVRGAKEASEEKGFKEKRASSGTLLRRVVANTVASHLEVIEEESNDIIFVTCAVTRKTWEIDLRKHKDKRPVHLAHLFPFERGDNEFTQALKAAQKEKWAKVKGKNIVPLSLGGGVDDLQNILCMTERYHTAFDGFHFYFDPYTTQMRQGFNYSAQNDDEDIGKLIRLKTKPLVDDRNPGAKVPGWMFHLYYHYHYLPSENEAVQKNQDAFDKLCGVCMGGNLNSKKYKCSAKHHIIHSKCQSEDGCNKCPNVCGVCQKGKNIIPTPAGTWCRNGHVRHADCTGACQMCKLSDK